MLASNQLAVWFWEGHLTYWCPVSITYKMGTVRTPYPIISYYMILIIVLLLYYSNLQNKALLYIWLYLNYDNIQSYKTVTLLIIINIPNTLFHRWLLGLCVCKATRTMLGRCRLWCLGQSVQSLCKQADWQPFSSDILWLHTYLPYSRAKVTSHQHHADQASQPPRGTQSPRSSPRRSRMKVLVQAKEGSISGSCYNYHILDESQLSHILAQSNFQWIMANRF